MKILYIDCFLGFDAAMLLGALADAGADAGLIKDKFMDAGICADVIVMPDVRAGIECKKASAVLKDEASAKMPADFINEITDCYGESVYTNALTMQAVLYAAELLEIDYVICSDIAVSDHTDGVTLSILESALITAVPTGDAVITEPADAAFLKAFAGECGPRPDMDIIAVGYGAGGEAKDKPHLISAVLGEFKSGLMTFEEHEELIEAL